MRGSVGLKKTLGLVLSLSLVLQAAPLFNKQAYAEPAPVDLKLQARSAILMDADTGQILYEMDPNKAYPPASMAKMMTEYLVMEAIDNGQIKWEDTVTTSKYAADVIGSGDMLAENEKLTVKDMFAAMSIYSANDASVALAEHIGGTEENFAKMMNEKAKAFGLSKDAHFISATGLSREDLGQYAPKGIQGETILSAKDAALIAYHIVKDHPAVLDFTKIPSQKLRPSDSAPMTNWNWMIETHTDTNYKPYVYQGLDGLKTGHTDEAGYCFTGTAKRGDMRLISVVMGTPSEKARFVETRKVLDYGFNNFERKTVVKAGETVDSLKTVDVKKGKDLTVPVVTGSELNMVVRKGSKDSEFVKTAKAVDESKLVAPIKKGTEVGTLTVKYQNTQKTIKLVAAEDVKKASWFRLFFRGIKDFFAGLGDTIKGWF